MSIEQVLSNLVDAINANTEALLRSRSEAPVVEETKATTKKAEKIIEAAKEANKTADEVVEKAKPAAKKAEPVEEAPEAGDLTIDDVRARLTPIIQKHSPSVVQSSLGELGVSKLSELEPNQYRQLLAVVAKATGEEV